MATPIEVQTNGTADTAPVVAADIKAADAAVPVSPGAIHPVEVTPEQAAMGGPGELKASYKRIIVCCDGTWQDGIEQKYRWQYTNVLKLARIFQREDARPDSSIQQIVYYQSGVGTEASLYSKYLGGGFGVGLAEKVQEAYAFIASNYDPGDEIFLFGFSRGAYTARMVAEFIGAIGILDKTDMDHFAEIFVAYQTLGQTMLPTVKDQQLTILKKFTDVTANGKLFCQPTPESFAIKCVGVFDTVGSIGLPEGLIGKQDNRLFGFNDRILGPHVEIALQALALNETRVDFTPAQFIQSEEGRKKGQILKQCWFSGAHTDVGGGYEEHDLSDISLVWMVANLEDKIAFDLDYLMTLLQPKAPYGELPPHDSHTGIFAVTVKGERELPKVDSTQTRETIHPSVKYQKTLRKDVAALLEAHSDMYWDLLPLEKKLQEAWPAKLEAAKALTNGAAPSAAGLIKPSTSTSPSTAVASTSAASSSKKRGSVILDTVKNIYGTITKRPATGEVPKTKDTKEPPAALEGLGQVKVVNTPNSWFLNVVNSVQNAIGK